MVTPIRAARLTVPATASRLTTPATGARLTAPATAARLTAPATAARLTAPATATRLTAPASAFPRRGGRVIGREHLRAMDANPPHGRTPPPKSSASRRHDPPPWKRKRDLRGAPTSHKPSGGFDQKRRRRSSSGPDWKRKWVHSPRDCSSLTDRFVLVSYNILGDENASKHADLYDRVDPADLDWDVRKRRICGEISRYNAGIVCLQEVDRFNDLSVLLQKGGLSGIYKGRTGEANDGCAIFWREDQFTILHEESIEFQKSGLRNNVAQICVFRMNLADSSSSVEVKSEKKESPSKCTFIVGNIHVLFNPNRGDIKLGQVRLLLEQAHMLSQVWGNCPVVIAGDWNCMPQSALYQFISSSKLDIRMHDRRKISEQSGSSWKRNVSYYHYETARRGLASCSTVKFRWSEEEIFLAVGREGTTHLHHPLKLFSAYPGVPGSSRTRDKCGEPLVTSYHSKFMGTVDYMWHSQGIVPVRLLDLLPIDIMRKTGGLPSQKWGSDHLALVCEFAFESGLRNLLS